MRNWDHDQLELVLFTKVVGIIQRAEAKHQNTLYGQSHHAAPLSLDDSDRDSHTQSPEQNDFASLPRQQVSE